MISGLGTISGNVTNSGTADFIGPTQVIGSLTNNPGATLTVRNSQLLVTGTGTNDGTITTVSGGSAVFNGGLTGNPVGAGFAGATTLGPGATLVADYVRQNLLTLQGTPGDPSRYARVTLRPRSEGGDSSTLSSLSIQTDASGNPLGRIDLADNTLAIIYANGPSPDAQVRSYLLAGYAHGLWGGDGITSSTAASDAGRLTLGYADGADGVVAGLSVGRELVKLAPNGDVNLDGTVGFADLLTLAQHYGHSAAKWDQGDLNYDGTVNFADLLILAQNYGNTLPAADLPAVSGIPEPAALSALTCAMTAFRSRRR